MQGIIHAVILMGYYQGDIRDDARDVTRRTTTQGIDTTGKRSSEGSASKVCVESGGV